MHHCLRAWVVVVALLGVSGCNQESEPGCETGAERCNAEGSGSFVCRDGVWEPKSSCLQRSESCSVVDGTAACYCSEGARDCSVDARSIRVCSGGVWVDDQACGQGDVCNYDGEADEVLCMDASVACDPYRERERCRVVAVAGDPNAKYTADAYTCERNGRWSLKAGCAEAEVCVMKPASAQEMAADALLDEVAVCEAFPCQEGAEYCPAGSATGNPHVCEDGKLVKREECPKGTLCAISPKGHATCVHVWTCEPGQQWCGPDGRAYTCNDDQEPVLKPGCEGPVSCVYSAAVATCLPACTPGERQCSSKTTAQVCGPDRAWHDAVVCAPDEECVVFEGIAACRPLAAL